MDFLVADPSAKYALVENLTKSWTLAPFGSAEPLKVIEEQVTIAEVKPSILQRPSTLLLVFLSANLCRVVHQAFARASKVVDQPHPF